MKNLQLIIILSILLLGCNSTKTPNETSPQLSYDSSFIDDLFKNYAGEKPSASVIVIQDGVIKLAKSYGYADIKNKSLATPETNYRLASVSKQFTATSIMILVNQGKLSYNTTLTDIFPEFPEYGKDITVRHILTHRSGLVRYNRFIKKGQTTQLLDKDVLNGLLKTDSTYFTPNTKYAYSNTGYAVLAQIVEKVSGMSFADFMKTEIFNPLEMTNATILELDKDIKNRAYGYLVKDSSITAKDQSLTSAIQGDGGVYASLMDYYKWDQALYADKLLPQAALAPAFIDYDKDGETSDNGYGYGWKVSYYKNTKVLRHGGSSAGFGSHVIRIPSENISVAIFTNRSISGQELPIRAEALLSHFTNGKFVMPFEIVLEKDIEENGIANGIDLYHKIKTDTLKYSISKGALFRFGRGYADTKKNTEALQLFKLLEREYPNYYGGYYGSAYIYTEEKNNKKAIESYQKVIEHSTEKEQWAAKRSLKMIKELSQ